MPSLFRHQNIQWSHNMVHSHFTLVLEGLWLPKTAFPTSMVRPLDESHGHFTHKTEGPWPLHSHWPKGQRPSKFTSHTKVKASRPKEDFMAEKSTRSPTWRTMDKVSWSSEIYVRPTSKRWAWRKFRETMILFYFIFFPVGRADSRQISGRILE